MVQEAVEDRSGEDFIAEDLAPFARLTATESNRARNRPSSNQRCGSKTTARPPFATHTE